MSASTWYLIAIVGFSLSGAALIAAVILFIRLNIPAIIGDLTGRTVAREIKALRDMNASNGDRRFRSSAVNIERGVLTDKILPAQNEGMAVAHASKRLDKTSGQLNNGGRQPRRRTGTVGLSDAARGFSGDNASGPTDVLDTGSTTEVLSDQATEVLNKRVTEELNERTTEPTDGAAAAAPVLRTDAAEALTRDLTEAPQANPTEPLTCDLAEAARTAPTEDLTRDLAEAARTNPTEVLANGASGQTPATTVLSRTEELKEDPIEPVRFKVTRDMLAVHSDEKIP